MNEASLLLQKYLGEYILSYEMNNSEYFPVNKYHIPFDVNFEKSIMNKTNLVEMKLMPGVEKLLYHLKSMGIQTAIATNVSKQFFEFLSKSCVDFPANFFDVIICGSDNPNIANNKPDPEIYLACYNNFSIRPENIENCLIFEDSYIGILGASASKIKTILVNKSESSKFDEFRNYIMKIQSFEDLIPESVGLPSYVRA